MISKKIENIARKWITKSAKKETKIMNYIFYFV